MKTGFIKDLEECELLITGISKDKISDISTKIMYLKKNDEKVQLLVQLNLLLKQNELLIKAKYPDILASILDSL